MKIMLETVQSRVSKTARDFKDVKEVRESRSVVRPRTMSVGRVRKQRENVSSEDKEDFSPL